MEPATNGSAAQLYQNRFGTGPGNGQVDEERLHWEQLCKELLEERERLRAENVRLMSDISCYEKTVARLMPVREFDISDEEFHALLGQKETIQDVINEFEKKPRA